jgi:ParB-like chromosome segregation protein Spo0J
MQIKQQIKQAFDDAENKTEFLQDLKLWIHEELSSHKSEPVDAVRWVPIEKVFANDYNPNSVAKNEMRLLYISISHDGYTQPIVTVYDEAKDQYVIVDGFHRYTTMKLNKDLYDKTNGMLPVVVIKKSINDRMASTVRHNRARGKHSVTGMANMVFQMLDNGWKDEAICAELGVEADELIRLKHVTGFSKLFENVDYRKAWETKRQIQLKKLYKDSLNESNKPTNN